MKKALALILVLALCMAGFAGCSSGASSAVSPALSASSAAPEPVVSQPVAERMPIRIGGLKGPTSMGMVRLMQQAEEKTSANDYLFTIAGSADEVTPKLLSGDLDIAAVPANLASVLYNNTKGAVKLLAINTLGVIYLVENGESIQSFEDLRGKTIYATGKGSIPEYALKYMLSSNGLDPQKDLTIEWKAEPTEVVAMLSQGTTGVALLPQPYVTAAQAKLPGLRVAIDLNQAWADLDNGSLFLTGVLVVRAEFAQEHPEEIAAFLDEYKASTEYVNANLPEAAALIEKYGIIKAAIAQKALPFCNITYLEGTEMQTAMDGYLKVLFEQNPKSVGGAIPGGEFYYAR